MCRGIFEVESGSKWLCFGLSVVERGWKCGIGNTVRVVEVLLIVDTGKVRSVSGAFEDLLVGGFIELYDCAILSCLRIGREKYRTARSVEVSRLGRGKFISHRSRHARRPLMLLRRGFRIWCCSSTGIRGERSPLGFAFLEGFLLRSGNAFARERGIFLFWFEVGVQR
jgi:hypothetical protein